jgi:CRISPR/Cas system-associated protein endoribonuclease Cas2
LKFGHEYILNSYQYYDLIIINDFIDGETINHAFIDRFIDILNKHGELWVFCISEDTYNKITAIFDKYKKKYYQKDLSKEGIFLYMVTIGK